MTSDDVELDWSAPLDATGEERATALRSALGLATPMLSAYVTELHGEISSQAWGFARLSDLADVEQRALVSDQLLSAAQGLLDGLVDAAICVHEHSRLTGPNGSPYPGCR